MAPNDFHRVSLLPYHYPKGVIVDSGTTDTYLPKRMAGQFKKAWKDIVGRDYGNSLTLGVGIFTGQISNFVSINSPWMIS